MPRHVDSRLRSLFNCRAAQAAAATVVGGSDGLAGWLGGWATVAVAAGGGGGGGPSVASIAVYIGEQLASRCVSV